MCKASKYVEEIDTLFRNMKKDFELLSKKQSEYDTMVAEHYHKIETANFNACEGYYLSKQLQEILRKRRIVKDELSRLHTIATTLNAQKMLNSINTSKQQINKAKSKSAKWQQDWNYTYTLEEILH